jgi:DNA-binding response OmpR family regulator
MPVGDESLRVIKQEALQEVQETPEVEEKDTASLFSFEKPVDTHRKNALLVEDDEAIRQYVQGELSSDLVVQLCANGQEAWDYIVAHQGKVDIVISDIMMPVMDGMTLCQKLKSNFNTNHIPVVLVTALGSDADRIIGISNGADAYVSKPFNIDVLRTTVMQLLKSRQLLQGKYHGDKQQEEHIDKVEMESPDENLMKRVMKVINENMDNPELSVELVADKVGISRVHFYRKMKDLTGQAPRDFVKYVRLKEAARLLADKNYDITGVSVATGFKSLSAFSTSFKALYGLTPSEWVKQHEE